MNFFRLFLLLGALPLGLSAQAITAGTPVESFRLPTFTREGHRSMLLQGSAALVTASRIELREMTLTLFSGDARNLVETVILSPVATVNPESEQVEGAGVVRVIRDDLEITGQGWHYDHAQKKVSITRDARIVFRAQLPDILK